MAIPFFVPSEDQSEAEWGVQVQMIVKRNILNLLNEVAAIRGENSAIPENVYPIFPNSAFTQPRNDGSSSPPPPPPPPPPARPNSVQVSTVLPSREATTVIFTNLPRRLRRRRTDSENSCCHEVKEDEIGATTTNRDWTSMLWQIVDDFQRSNVEVENEEQSECPHHRCKRSNGGLLSKIMPTAIKSSIWTAVICVIGWHLFRTR